MPPTIVCAGTLRMTTALAPISESFPIFIPPIILAPQHISTLSPIIGASSA